MDWTMLVALWAAVLIAFWFGVLGPKRKELREHKELIASLKKGDKVVTVGGIHGRIIGFKNGAVRLEIAQNVSILVERSAIRRRIE
jgi:preprotein translocase subunit YajC